MNNLITKIIDFSNNGNSIAKRKWLRFVGLTILELIMVTLLAWPFLETTAAHPALPQDLEQTPQMVEPAEFGPTVDMGPVNDNSEAAIPALQGSASLTVSIETSPEAVIDNNFSPPSKTTWPEVTVVAAAVTNESLTVAAENVEVVLDYNGSDPWLLVGDEIPTRTISSLAPNTTEWVYWFASYISDTAGITHTYTVSAEADNATPAVSTSQNSHAPGLGYTIETVEYASSANQGLAATDFNVDVGVAFTVTQLFDTGSNPDFLLLNPVGNNDFDAGAYHLVSVGGRFLSGTTELDVFSDEVYVSVPAGFVQDNITSVEVYYEFVALLPNATTACSYMGVLSLPNTRQYDNNYCEGAQVMDIDGTLSLSMTKQVSTANIQQGGGLQYTITYTNNATSTIGSLWIWDDLPTGVSIVSGTINPANDTDESSSTRVAWNITNLAPGGLGTLSFSVLVDGGGADIPDGTVLLNEANMAIIQPSLAADDYRVLFDTATTTVRAPGIAMTKTDGATTAAPGDSLTYVIQITNTGTNPASGLVLTDVLPANVILGTPSPGGFTQNGQTLVWDNTLGTIAGNGGTLSVSIPYQIDPELSVDGTVLTNNAELSYQNSAGVHTFTSVTAQDVTTLDVPITSLGLNKTAQDVNGPPLAEGDIIIYTVEVSNTGSSPAYNVVVTDTLPSQVTCLSVTGGPGACANPIVWNVGTLAAGELQTMLIQVQINLGTANDNTIINNVEVTSSNVPTPPPDDEVCPDGSTPSPNCTGDGVPIPSTTLELNKTATADDPLEVGGNITYTLWVTNAGSEIALDVTVTDDLPDEVDCVSVTPSPPTCADPLIWEVGDLAANGDPGYTASLMILVEVNDSGAGQSIINTVSVTATNVPIPPTIPPVCPDGSEPDTNGDCPDNTIPPGGGGIFLPLITKS